MNRRNKAGVPPILKALSYAGAVNVLAALAREDTKFTNLMWAIQTNPSILNRVLHALVNVGLVQNTPDGYSLTPRGAEALGIVANLEELCEGDASTLREALEARRP